jgi:hypothetical protein
MGSMPSSVMLRPPMRIGASITGVARSSLLRDAQLRIDRVRDAPLAASI